METVTEGLVLIGVAVFVSVVGAVLMIIFAPLAIAALLVGLVLALVGVFLILRPIGVGMFRYLRLIARLSVVLSQQSSAGPGVATVLPFGTPP